MFDDVIPTDQSRVLAELLDMALADNWSETRPTMALLWQASDDPDDLRLAVKNLEGSVEDELADLDADSTYLAVAHSAVTHEPPPALSSEAPVRITVAVDHAGQSGVIRHPNGGTRWFGAAVHLPIAEFLRAHLWLERAA